MPEPEEPLGEISADEFKAAQRDPLVQQVLRDADELYDAYEPSGDAVGALREALALTGVEVTPGAARAALVAALCVEYERKRQKRAARIASDPRRST